MADEVAALEVPAEVQRDLHRRMVRIRVFEETAGRLAEQSRLPGFLHLYVGQEAVAAGACAALRDTDQITSTHRGHGHLVAKGGDFRRMMAELMGKATGYCRGRGGSMHINDLSLGMLGANGIVGAGVPIAVGAAFANRYREGDGVAVAFFGDGATNIGAFHEAASMASALELPVVFLCENNEYAEYTPRWRVMKVADVADRAAAYAMPSSIVDGMDVLAVFAAMRDAVATMRAGGGPVFIEAKTYRYYNHHGIQVMGIHYREDSEVEAWRLRDPITALEGRMEASGVLDADGAKQVWDQTNVDIEDAVTFAESSPDPDPADILTGVYTEVLT